MATRRQIREAFYSELETAATGLVDSASISQQYPDTQEELPVIVHDDAYRRIPMNTGAAPKDITRDSNGNAETLYYSIMMQAVFSVLIMSDDESEKEDIYEAVRSHFEEYRFPYKNAGEIQTDISQIQVLDVNSQDDEDREPIARGDSLTVNIDYERIITRDVNAISGVEHSFDIEITEAGDGTIDYTKNTT